MNLFTMFHVEISDDPQLLCSVYKNKDHNPFVPTISAVNYGRRGCQINPKYKKITGDPDQTLQ